MRSLAFLLLFLPLASARAEVSRCDRIKAEAEEIRKLTPTACDESKEAHATYLKGFPEAFALCDRLEGEASGKDETGEDIGQLIDLKQKHIAERQEISDRVIRELFPTPLDRNDPARLPPTVSADCSAEIETHAHFRRNLMRIINEIYLKIDRHDDDRMQRSLTGASAAPVPAPEPPAGPATGGL